MTNAVMAKAVRWLGGILAAGGLAVAATLLLDYLRFDGPGLNNLPVAAAARGTASAAPALSVEERDGPLALDTGEPIQPIVAPPQTRPGRVALGARLFHDRRLAADGQVACASRHQSAAGGADPRPLSRGVDGREGRFNAPTVRNAALNFRQYWDGRAASLRTQVDGPLLGTTEMAGRWDRIIPLLAADVGYAAGFAAAYPEGLTIANVRDAFVQYQRSLVIPGAPFDRWLLGDKDAISAEAAAGYRLFKSLGCTACHQGVGVGGNMFNKMGMFEDYFAARGDVRPADLGRFNATGREEDRFVFKVPSLRNVALTAPYFHDGAATSLADAVRIMARFQLGRQITPLETRSLVAFLETLTAPSPADPAS